MRILIKYLLLYYSHINDTCLPIYVDNEIVETDKIVCFIYKYIC